MASSTKPALLCLHGGGTNATIYNIQTIRLRRELDKVFEFVFVNAPWEAKAGPGVLPIFEGAGPFTYWCQPLDPKNNQVHQNSIDVIDQAIKDQVAKTGKPFVGMMGFSEGGRLAAGIALYQQLEREKLKGSGESDDGKYSCFRFSIFLNATTPPLYLTEPPATSEPKITIPSLHVIGVDDSYAEESRDLVAEYFDPKTSKVMEFNVGHSLPTARADSVKLANGIISLYKQVSGD